MLPSPSQLINAPKFATWFPGQEDLTLKLLAWIKGDKRYLCANVPTGFGKSICAILSGWLSGDKVVYITETKGLQDQLMDDFEEPIGLVKIMGQNNYTCIDAPPSRVDQGKCHAGVNCRLRSSCTYYSSLDAAIHARIVNTNYAYWLAQNFYTQNGLMPENDLGEVEGTYPMVIMDEAHKAGAALEQHLTIKFNEIDFQTLSWDIEEAREWSWDEWKNKAANKRMELHHDIEELKKELKTTFRKSDLQRFQRLQSLWLRLGSIAGSQIEWVREWTAHSVSLCPVWPSQYNSRLLIGEKILLMSGTLTRKSVEKLGITEEECEWIDSPSPFDPGLSPINHIETIRLTYKTPAENMRVWARRIDQIREMRTDRKGILFTVSYARGQLYQRLTEYEGDLVVHSPHDMIQRIKDFKQMKAPGMLVTPDMSGYDFPDDECEYIIIGKVPFVTATGELTKARQEDDKDWVHFLAMEKVVQQAGRGTRKMSDYCEVFVVDDMWTWWWPKYKGFSPGWFQDRVGQSLSMVPGPRYRR